MKPHKYFLRLILLFCLGFFIGQKELKAERLRSGDLIFQSEGTGSFSKAISEATGEKDSLNFVHVGIIEIAKDGNIYVIEASPEKGVILTSLDDFIKSTPQKNDRPTVVVKRLTIDFPIEETIERAHSFLGQPYDWWYLPDNNKMYCSELIYESYLDAEGNKIFTAKPMNFRASDGTMPDFWTELFNKLGMEVPEGVPGTNPNDLAKMNFLKVISL